MSIVRFLVGLSLAMMTLIGVAGRSVGTVDAKGGNFRKVCPPGVHGAMRCLADVVTDSQGNPLVTTGPPSSGYGPLQFHTAYRLPCSVNGAQPQSICTPPATFGGQTIGIVDWHSDPTIQADLNVYDTAYGLPACTTANGCLTIANQYGQASPLPAPDHSWASEIALDVETAHEICQTCKIVLIEADDVMAGVNAAVSLGATEISNSYTLGEFSGETADDVYYNHPGVVIAASSGDGGYGANYPATSPYVVAVGGTTLTLDSTNNYQSESVWNNSGSGCSAYEPASSWQMSVPDWSQTGCGSRRGSADVAADADPGTGAAVYDSYGYGGWVQLGGTSLSSPIIAGVYALAGGVPSSVSAQSIPYKHFSSSNSHDVTTGTNGSCGTVMCNATAGYDGPTGLGTPNGLAGFSSNLAVTTTSDTASCPGGSGQPGYSLRCAITQANIDGAGDTITFTIPSTDAGCAQQIIQGSPVGVCMISVVDTASQPPDQLPTLTANTTTINGYTQLGASPNTNPLTMQDNAVIAIQIDGTRTLADDDGLDISGSNDIVEGLSITNFAGSPSFVGGFGIRITGAAASHDTIQGNFLGVSPNGSAAGNHGGVGLDHSGQGNTIGGTATAARNLISGNQDDGAISMLQDAGNTTVQGNFILNNGADGLWDNSTGGNNLIGGTGAGAGNVMSGNGAVGLDISAPGDVVQGNLIGTDPSGSQAMGNKHEGIYFSSTATTGTVGGTGNGAANTIANNGAAGVEVAGSASSPYAHIAINRNTFSGNVLGIDLAPEGTVNCSTSPPGPNDDTPCPVITSVSTSQVSGTACAGCTVEVYAATNETDDQGHGEGQRFLGSAIASSTGAWSLSLSAGQTASGTFVTATATTGSAPLETSEFAANVAIPAAAQVFQVQAGAAWNLVGGNPLTLWSDSVVNWAWNASTGQWYHPTATAPAGTGAWEYLSTAGSRSVTVQACDSDSPVSIPVVAHRWNMIGNPCSVAVSLPSTARGLGWDSSAQKYSAVTTIAAGAAAWVEPGTSPLVLTPVAQ